MRAALIVGSLVVASVAGPSTARAADPAGPGGGLPAGWTGFSAGLFLGYGALDNRLAPSCISVAGIPQGTGCRIGPVLRPVTEDVVAGGEVGYDREIGAGLVLGVAADHTVTRLRGYADQEGLTIVNGRALPSGTAHAGQRLDGFGTLRGRVGLAIDRALVYATAGLAYGTVRIDATETRSTGARSAYGGFSDARDGDERLGFAVGGGIAYAFGERVSAKVETLYYDLGSRTVMAHGISRNTLAESSIRIGTRARTSGVLARIGLTYHFGDGALGTADAAPARGAPASFDLEAGLRYFGSTGTQRATIAAPGNAAQLNSRLTYAGLAAHAGESFARLDHRPTGLFVKGFVGAGGLTSGRLADEDFVPARALTARSDSTIRDGGIAYGVADAGYSLLSGEDYRLGAFLGYQFLQEGPNAVGCRQVAGSAFGCGPFAVGNVRTISEDAHWSALRIGLAGEIRRDRVRIGLEGAYLPVAAIQAYDRHWLRPDINPQPQWGSGDGVFVQGVVSYDVTPDLSIGVGGRYWHMEAGNGRSRFPLAPASPTRLEADRLGGFLQASYRFSVPSL
ncbi:outer membrane beta-barrel protein [Methylobacterium sp. JK268]